MSESPRRRLPRRSLGGILNALPQWAGILLVIVTLLAVWQLIVALGLFPRIIFPSPLDVLYELGIVLSQMVTSDFLIRELLVTVREILTAFVIATIVGFSVGLLVGLTRFGRRAILPLFVLLEATPKIAFAPVFIAWFGFGLTSNIVLAAFLSVFPVIIGTVSGLEATGDDELRLFASLRATQWQVFLKLKLYRALPFVFAGLKIAVVAAVTGTVAAEFIGGGVGFGEQIRIAGTRLALDRVFALIVFLSALGLLLFSIVAWLQRRLAFWDQPRSVRRNPRTKASTTR
jgi:NitT/TauT family transport system permease protein